MATCHTCGREIKGQFCSSCGTDNGPKTHSITDYTMLILIIIVLGGAAICAIIGKMQYG